MKGKAVEKKRYIFVALLKAFAALLIINSHYDQIYPIEELATGGAIGNAIFFAISGFCLYPVSETFIQWIPNRLAKLYIPTLIMTMVALLTYKKGELMLDTALSILIWPTFYWFVGAIIIFYILFYILKEVKSDKAFLVLGLILTLIYVLYYVILPDKTTWVIEAKGLNSLEGYFKLIYYFAAMMMGKWFRIHIDKEYKKSSLYLAGMVGAFISIYAVKLLIIKIPEMMPLQFLNQISVLIFVAYAFMFSLSIESYLRNMENTKFYGYIKYISNITLCLYLVQFVIIEYTYRMLFPINFVFASIAIFASASVLNFISNSIFIGLKNLIRKKQ